MAASTSGKILRIGILQEGRIIEERLMRKRETITIGETAKCTFIIPFAKLPVGKRFPVFPCSPQGFSLSFTEAMKGKISLGGSVLDLPEFVKNGKATKKNGVHTLALNEDMRGKVTIGDVLDKFEKDGVKLYELLRDRWKIAPLVGEPGVASTAPEVRIEMVAPRGKAAALASAARRNWE